MIVLAERLGRRIHDAVCEVNDALGKEPRRWEDLGRDVQQMYHAVGAVLLKDPRWRIEKR